MTANASKHVHAEMTLSMSEVIRYVDKDGKQRTGTEETVWFIGREKDIRPLDFIPVSEQRFDLSPWAYKPASAAHVRNGNTREIVKNGVSYLLATDKDGAPIPATYTAPQMVKLMCDALSDGAAEYLDGSGVVGYSVTFTPVANWQTASKGAKLSQAHNRKNRHGRKDSAASKQARATARKNARTSK